MTVKQDEIGEDEMVVTLSEDGKTAGEKAAPTKEELEAARKTKEAAGEEEDDGEDDQQEDERHAVGAGEEDDKRRKNRAEARRNRKAARRQREEDRERENQDLRERLAALEGRVTTVAQTNGQQTIAIVDQRISEASAAREAADAAMEEAITKQDGKTFKEAQKARDLAIEAIRQLAAYKSAFEHQQKTSGQQQQAGPDPRLVNYARQFKADNPWIEFDTSAADKDSKTVHALDAAVLRAGYDPTTPEYWEELQDRVDRKFPAKLTEMSEEQEEKPAARTQQQRPAGRRGPAMSGGRSTPQLGKNDAIVPKALKEAAGKDWNDPVARADIIKRYQASVEKYGAAK